MYMVYQLMSFGDDVEAEVVEAFSVESPHPSQTTYRIGVPLQYCPTPLRHTRLTLVE